MIQKKSLYIIDYIVDKPTALVRKGSTVKLSDGSNEWILLEDWETYSSFYEVSSYSKNDIVANYQTSIDMVGKVAANVMFDGVSLSDQMTFLVSISVGDGESISAYQALLSDGSKNVIVGRDGIYTEYSGSGEIIVAHTITSTEKVNVKISIISDKTVDDFRITPTYSYVAYSDVGYNDEIDALKEESLSVAESVSTNTINIASNTSDIASLVAKQSQTDYTSGLSLGSTVTGGITDISYCRVSRSKYITNVQAKISCSFSSSTGNLQIRFPFATSGAKKVDLLNGCYSSFGTFYRMSIIDLTPLKVEVIDYQPETTSPDLTFNFSVLGSW